MRNALLLALLSAVLIVSGQLLPPLAPLLLIALVPLLWAERSLSHHQDKVLLKPWLPVATLFVLLWQGAYAFSFDRLGEAPTWGLAALMLAALLLFQIIKFALGLQRGYLSLPFLWISIASLSFWGLGQSVSLLPGAGLMHLSGFNALGQWLGQLGLGLWILIFNLIVFLLIWQKVHQKSWPRGLLVVLLVFMALIFVPLWLSPEGNQQASEALGGFAPVDRFVARISLFISIFLLLFTAVKLILERRETNK